MSRIKNKNKEQKAIRCVTEQQRSLNLHLQIASYIIASCDWEVLLSMFISQTPAIFFFFQNKHFSNFTNKHSTNFKDGFCLS